MYFEPRSHRGREVSPSAQSNALGDDTTPDNTTLRKFEMERIDSV